MLWQPMHMAVLASRVFSPAAGAWACTEAVTQATARAKSVENRLFILRSQLGAEFGLLQAVNYIRRLSRAIPRRLHEVPRHTELRRHPGPDAGRERGHRAAAPAAGQGRARYR